MHNGDFLCDCGVSHFFPYSMNLQLWNDVADLPHWRSPATRRECCYRLHRIYWFLSLLGNLHSERRTSVAFLEGCDNGRKASELMRMDCDCTHSIEQMDAMM